MRVKDRSEKGYDLVIIARRPAINLDYTGAGRGSG